MRSMLSWLGLVIVLGLAIPALAADDKTDKKPAPKEKDKYEGKDSKWVAAGDYQVTVSRVDAPQKILAVQLQVPYANGRSVAYRAVDVELQTADEIKVRLAQPPIEFDVKGNPKKYTSKELKALKGPGKLWGFPGDFDSIKPGQIVHVFLKKPKEAPRYGRRTKEDKDLQDENKPTVTMVYIIAEPRK